MAHNHFTRDVKPSGQCPACDLIHAAMPPRCQASFSTPYGDRRCDLADDHDGVHVRNDGAGRPEYFWPQTSPPAVTGGAAPPNRDH